MELDVRREGLPDRVLIWREVESVYLCRGGKVGGDLQRPYPEELWSVHPFLVKKVSWRFERGPCANIGNAGIVGVIFDAWMDEVATDLLR